METKERIQSHVDNNDIVLYMKGTPQAPQCGFSHRAVQILQLSGVQEVFAFNVLEDPDIRQGIKEFSNWPTIPQLYIKGEFIGGCDIMTEMFESGELQEKLSSLHNADAEG